MASIKQEYGANNQALTLTLASLASSPTAGRESNAVDNTTNKYLDALVVVKVKTSASALANDKAVYVYAYGTVDGGSSYSDTATGSDAAITLSDPANMRLIGIINCPATSTTYKGGPFSVAAAFGGILPDHWGIVIRNYTGQALDSTGGNMSAVFQGTYQSVA